MDTIFELLNSPTAQKRWVKWLLIYVAWMVPAVLFASQMYVSWSSAGKPISWWIAYRDQLVYSWLWATATPLILHLARRFPIERPGAGRRLIFHLALSLVISILQRALYTAYSFAFPIMPTRAFKFEYLFRNVFSLFDYGILIYWMILAVCHAMEYYRKFRENEIRASHLEMRLAQSQLQALKMQLHPHFLFNTLHSISALMNKDMKTADKMISRLGDFLRLTLENSGAQQVTLQQELDFLKCYLEIEQIRFQDRLSVQMNIDPEIVDAKVPNLILQPIVENAIRHGIAPRVEPGIINIDAQRHNGMLEINIKDNGPGLNSNGNGNFREGVGLSNTRARLSQLYGDLHRFNLKNAEGGGLVVNIQIPIQKELEN